MLVRSVNTLRLCDRAEWIIKEDKQKITYQLMRELIFCQQFSQGRFLQGKVVPKKTADNEGFWLLIIMTLTLFWCFLKHTNIYVDHNIYFKCYEPQKLNLN